MKPVSTARMWEVRAAAGQVEELLAWVRGHGVPTLTGADRVEVYRSDAGGEQRVVVISHWSGPPAALPDPPGELVARAPHAWDFQRVG